MKRGKDIFPECANCKTMKDCPRPDIDTDGLSSPLPPEGCPQPIQVMENTMYFKRVTDNRRN